MNISKLSLGTMRKRGIDNGVKKTMIKISLSSEKKANKIIIRIIGINENI